MMSLGSAQPNESRDRRRERDAPIPKEAVRRAERALDNPPASTSFVSANGASAAPATRRWGAVHPEDLA